MRALILLVLALVLSGISTNPVLAQEDSSTILAVGELAPDFSLPGGTRHGLLRDPIRLSDYRGKTVVLAFFFRARTRG